MLRMKSRRLGQAFDELPRTLPRAVSAKKETEYIPNDAQIENNVVQAESSGP